MVTQRPIQLETQPLARLAASICDILPARSVSIVGLDGDVLGSFAPGDFTLDADGAEASVVWRAALEFESRAVGSLTLLLPAGSATAGDPLYETVRQHAAVAVACLEVAPMPLDARWLELAASLADVSDEEDTLATLSKRVTRLAEDLVGSRSAAIFVWDDERSLLKSLPGAFGTSGPAIAAMGGPGTDMRSNSARVFRAKQAYLTNRAVGDPGILQNYVSHHSLERILSVPLMAGSRSTGVLHLANKPTDFTAEDLRRAEALAPWVAAAVNLAVAVNKLRVQQSLDAILSDAAVSMASNRDLSAALIPAFDSFGTVMCAAVIALVPRSGSPVLWRSGETEPSMEADFLRDAAQHGASATMEFSRHAADDPEWAEIHVPVHLAGDQIASLSLLRRKGVPFAPHETHALERLGRLSTLAWLGGRSHQQQIALARLHERQRIADDLHDRVAQILFAAQLGLDSALEEEDLNSATGNRIREVRTLLSRGDTVIRDVIHQLTPVPASATTRLRLAARDVEEQFAFTVQVIIDSDARAALDTARRAAIECLLRVAREACVNAAKHSGATRITVRLTLEQPAALQLSISDDGCGMPPNDTSAGYGIPSLHRAVTDARGTLVISPAPTGTGTCVIATVAY